MTPRVPFLLLVMCIVGISASLTIPAEAQHRPYLALGDSVPFGFITRAGFEYLNADIVIGFPKYIRQDLRFAISNAACPGETTSSFMSSNGADVERCPKTPSRTL